MPSDNGLRESIEWVLTDMRYKAPEQYIDAIIDWDKRLQETLDSIKEEESIADEVKRALIRFPEHAKVTEVADKSAACGNFIVFLLKKGIRLATPLMEDGTGLQEYEVSVEIINKLVAEFFDVDYDAFEREKQVMLSEVRVNNERN